MINRKLSVLLCLFLIACGPNSSSSSKSAKGLQSQQSETTAKFKKIERDGDNILLDEGHNVCVADAGLCEKTIALTKTIDRSNAKSINQLVLPGLKAITLQAQEDGCAPAIGNYELAHTGAIQGRNSLGIMMIASKDLSNPQAECAIIYRETKL